MEGWAVVAPRAGITYCACCGSDYDAWGPTCRCADIEKCPTCKACLRHCGCKGKDIASMLVELGEATQNGDEEIGHHEADKYLCGLVLALAQGTEYEELCKARVTAFQEMSKWYA